MSFAAWWSSARTAHWCDWRTWAMWCWGPRTTTSTSPSAVSTRCSSASRWHRAPTYSTWPRGCAQTLPEIATQLPTGVTQKLAYDATQFVTSSISEVIKTLVEALIIVTVVIFLFLGSARAVFVPVVAMPLSLVGAFFIMAMLGYSINLLTLLALVLAIGLVVDDAIIVVENVDRH